MLYKTISQDAPQPSQPPPPRSLPDGLGPPPAEPKSLQAQAPAAAAADDGGGGGAHPGDDGGQERWYVVAYRGGGEAWQWPLGGVVRDRRLRFPMERRSGGGGESSAAGRSSVWRPCRGAVKANWALLSDLALVLIWVCRVQPGPAVIVWLWPLATPTT